MVTVNEATVFTLSVDWSRTTEEMFRINRADWSTSDPLEPLLPRLRTSGVVEDEYKLFHFNRYILPDDAVREMGEGWEPAGPYETLAYGEKFPKSRREFPVAGLGTPVWQDKAGRRLVVLLGGRDSNCHIYLSFWSHDLLPSFRVLAHRLPTGQAGK